jgi:hypothetical protein
MKQAQIDRLFNIDFFRAVNEFSGLELEIIDASELARQYPDNPELIDEKVKEWLLIYKVRSLLIEEAWEHLQKVIEIFKLIENSLYINKEALIDLVIHSIDKGFKRAGKLKTKNISDLIFESWGYRAGVIDGIFGIIIKYKGQRLEMIKHEIYREPNPKNLSVAREKLTEYDVDFGIEKESDFLKLLGHLENRLTTLRDQRIFMIKSFVKRPQGLRSDLTPDQVVYLFEQLKAPENRFIHAKTSTEDFSAIFNPEPLPKGFKPVKWNKSNRLLSYFFTMLWNRRLIHETWQSQIEASKLFKNQSGKDLKANDLAVAKKDYETYGNPRGFESIDKILKSL